MRHRLDQIEVTKATQPPQMSMLNLAQMARFSAALTREIDAAATHAGELRKVSTSVDGVIKAKTP